jgi:hypothetical protein
MKTVGRYWSRTLTGAIRCQWNLLDSGLKAVQAVLEPPAVIPTAEGVPPRRATKAAGTGVEELIRLALERTRQGLSPPKQIYEAPYRDRIDWSKFPDWARPSDPELFEGSCHEG